MGSSNCGAYILSLLDWTFDSSPLSRCIITPRIDGTNSRQVMFQSNRPHLGLTTHACVQINAAWKSCSSVVLIWLMTVIWKYNRHCRYRDIVEITISGLKTSFLGVPEMRFANQHNRRKNADLTADPWCQKSQYSVWKCCGSVLMFFKKKEKRKKNNTVWFLIFLQIYFHLTVTGVVWLPLGY